MNKEKKKKMEKKEEKRYNKDHYQVDRESDLSCFLSYLDVLSIKE